MKLIPLSKMGKKYAGKYFAQVDDEDYEWISNFNWSIFIKCDVVYARRNIKKEDGSPSTILMHREIMGVKFGREIFIDHKDHDTLNNQRSNLRLANSSTNQKNKKPRGKSKYLGVTTFMYNGRKTKAWKAGINNNGKQIHLGLFGDEIEAAKAYDEAAKKYHGEFANLNFK